jgi:hypothetical protein
LHRKRGEPCASVGIGERNAAAHLRAVARRMKIIAFDQGPAQGLCHGIAETRFAATGDAHDDE